jgi:glyoxylate reductase
MKKVFVTRKIPSCGIKILKDAGYSVKVSPHDRALTRAEIIKYAKDYDGLLSQLNDNIDGKLMDAIGADLKVIANYAVGYDNIDLEAAKERNIAVTNTPDASTQSVAEYAFALMLSLAKRIPEADEFSRNGEYKGWSPMTLLGCNMYEKEVGIIGLGRIGLAIAKMAVNGFGMKVNYSDLKRNRRFERKFKARYLTIDELLKQSDFVTLHVPLLSSTKHLIGAKEFKKMKKTAFLVNTARGPVVDEKALAQALKKGEINGAGLDVFEFEPKIVKSLTKMDNVILTPHIASASTETRCQMADKAAISIVKVLSRKKVKNKVN